MCIFNTGRCPLLRAVCLSIALMLAWQTIGSGQPGTEPVWLDMLKNDKRLQVEMAINLGHDPTVATWFAAIKKETGVTLT